MARVQWKHSRLFSHTSFQFAGDLVVDDLGDLGAVEALRPPRGSNSSRSGANAGGVLGERDVDHARRTTSTCSGVNPSFDLSMPSCMPWHAISSPLRE